MRRSPVSSLDGAALALEWSRAMIGLRGAFRRGDVVQVRSEAEILATLDANGRLDALPFMPEMLRYCGQTLPVFRRADKTCVSMWHRGLRRMERTVFLGSARCDGSAHGDCQAECLLFWKEAWLKPAPDARGGRTGPGEPRGSRTHVAGGGCSRADLERATVPVPPPDAVYVCQATEIARATTPLPAWDVRQYLRDVLSGNVGMRHAFVAVTRRLVSKAASRLRRRSAVSRPGSREDIPELALEPGDPVRVRSGGEIAATLDASAMHRGLAFLPEMLAYCGQDLVVGRRVDRIIDPRTGRMSALRDCVVLDGVACNPDYHRFCQRSAYTYWREAWLERAERAP